MQKSKLDKLRIAFATIFILFTTFTLLFSTFEKQHEAFCDQENCPICFVIQSTQENLKLLITVFSFFTIFFHINTFFKKQIFFRESSVSKSNSLIFLKIRIND